MTTARIQNHHIKYDPEWVAELKMSWHRVISRIQNTRATPEQYMLMTNFMHSLAHEWNRMRLELDCEGDYRERNPNKEPRKK